MRRSSLHRLSGTNRICGVADDFVSRLEITEDLYIAVHTQASDYIHPFRLPIAYSLDEGALLVIGHGGDGHKHGWSSAMDRPLHTTETAGRQTTIGAMDVQLNGHRPGIQVHVMRNARNWRMEGLTGIGRNSKRHLLAYLHFPHGCFGDGHDQSQMISIDNLHNGHRSRLAGGRSNQCSGMQISGGDDSVKRCIDVQIRFELRYSAQSVPRSCDVVLC